MADDDKNQSATDNNADDKNQNQDDLGDGGKKALEAERKARKAAEKEKKDLEARLKELEDKDKSESDRLRDAAAVAEKKAQDAEMRAMRLEVATTKGLTPAQAKRLVGTTQEELESDADEFLESIKPSDDNGKPPGDKPRENLRGGGSPDDTPAEMDPQKLAEAVPRY